MKTLRDMTVLVTGASQGIGEAIARDFCGNGAQVVLFARSGDRLEALATELRGGGGQALAVAGDVTSYEQVAGAVDTAVRRFDSLDVLINNAGLIEPIARLADSDPAAWGQLVDINLKGVYHGLRAAIPAMLATGKGTIINMSSGAATTALEGWSHYCSTKAAVLSLTRCAHLEYGHRGIRIVGLSPGTVATDMQSRIRESGINPVSQLDPAAHIPPAWVAQAARFLCSEGGAEFAGSDFSLKTDDARRRLGLPMT